MTKNLKALSMKLINKNSTGNYREYEHNGEYILFSYDVVVAAKIPNIGIYLDEQYWDRIS